MFKTLLPWGLMVLIAIIAFLLTGWQYQSHQVDLLKIQRAAQEQVITSQKDTIRIQGNDMQLLSTLMQKSNTVIIKQQEANKKLNEIPDTSHDHPFTNPELSAAAGIVRDHQNAAYPPSPPNNPH